MFIVKWDQLQEVIEALNKSELTGKVTPKPSGQIIHNFMKAVEAIPENMDESIPEIVTDFYNNLVVKIEDEGKSVVLDVNEEKEKKKKKTKTRKKTQDPLEDEIIKDEKEKEKVKKYEKKKEHVSMPLKKVAGYDEYGARLNAGTHQINNSFKEGLLSFEEIAEKLGTTVSRIHNHYRHLLGKDVKFETIKNLDGRIVQKIMV